MIYKSVGEIYQSIEKTRGELKEKISALTAEQLAMRDGAEGWTVAEIFEHLAAVEGGIVRIAGKLAAQSNGENAEWNGTFAEPLSLVEQVSTIKDRKLEAPKMVHPSGASTIAESLAKLEENRRALTELRPRLEAVNASDATFPHPFFGALNAYQWLAVVGLHERRHLAQIEGILSGSAAKSN